VIHILTGRECGSCVLGGLASGSASVVLWGGLEMAKIINCHEPNTSKAKTIEALPAMIDGLREKGYWVMSVGQLRCTKEKTLEAGLQYDSID
jgi:hypothetical protein